VSMEARVVELEAQLTAEQQMRTELEAKLAASALYGRAPILGKIGRIGISLTSRSGLSLIRVSAVVSAAVLEASAPKLEAAGPAEAAEGMRLVCCGLTLCSSDRSRGSSGSSTPPRRVPDKDRFGSSQERL
jgi:hypothetical protein